MENYNPVEFVQAADDEAYASQLAFLLGPKQFFDHLIEKEQEIEERLRKQNESFTPSTTPT